ncbi:MAG: PIG-L family deacetylase [Nitrolancea sp.]
MADRPVRHVFLAPHYDDVSLSCGGTVAQLAAAGETPVIVTVMGGIPEGPLTAFALDQHSRWGFAPDEAVEMRRKEDQCSANALGAESVWLGLLDAIYRGDHYTSDEAIFGAVNANEDDLATQIVDELVTRLPYSLSSYDQIYVPLAIGNHVDHQLTFHAGRVLASCGHEVWGYEDFPYAGDPAWQGAIRERTASLGCGDARLIRLSEADVARKVEAVHCYASQLGVIFRFQGDPESAIRRYASTVGEGKPAERYWQVQASSQ